MSLAIEEPTPLEQLNRHSWTQLETPLGSLPWGEPPALGAWRQLGGEDLAPADHQPFYLQAGRAQQHQGPRWEAARSSAGSASGLGPRRGGSTSPSSTGAEIQKSALRNATATAIFSGTVEPMTGLVLVPRHRIIGAEAVGSSAIARDRGDRRPKATLKRIPGLQRARRLATAR